MVVVGDDTRAGDLLSIAESLTQGSERELIIVHLLKADADVTAATAALTAQREALVARGVSVRVAAYTSTEAAADAAMLASDNTLGRDRDRGVAGPCARDHAAPRGDARRAGSGPP